MNYYSFKLRALEEWAEVRPRNPNLRLGQVYFNLLADLRPDLANELRGTPHDPYFRNEIPQMTEDVVLKEWDDNTEFPLDDERGASR
jgi:hypothetical protein